jgi:hypothetical protein
MSIILLFDYMTMDDEARAVVRQKTGEIRERIRRTTGDLIEIGERLIEIKDQLGHGQFLGWLKAEFDWSERTAQNLMSVADAFKSATVADLPIGPKALYALAAPSVPEPARQEAIALAENGHQVTHADAGRAETGFEKFRRGESRFLVRTPATEIRMRFLLDPCVHLLLIAALLLAVALGFHAEREWRYDPSPPSSPLKVGADDRP